MMLKRGIETSLRERKEKQVIDDLWMKMGWEYFYAGKMYYEESACAFGVVKQPQETQSDLTTRQELAVSMLTMVQVKECKGITPKRIISTLRSKMLFNAIINALVILMTREINTVPWKEARDALMFTLTHDPDGIKKLTQWCGVVQEAALSNPKKMLAIGTVLIARAIERYASSQCSLSSQFPVCFVTHLCMLSTQQPFNAVFLFFLLEFALISPMLIHLFIFATLKRLLVIIEQCFRMHVHS